MDSLIDARSSQEVLTFENFKQEVLNDYRIATLSRHVSLTGRREVLTGKAKFGIFGDGKELPQVALAKFFKPGDWRSGYYRDQTWMFALGIATPQQFFAQLYADPNIDHDPWSAGRQMNAHFTTPNVKENGEWCNLGSQVNSSTDMAPTASQMPRSLGLAYASKIFRDMPLLAPKNYLGQTGSEVCFCSIGDASTSEGHFWETVNAACVAGVPLAIFVWDDGFGISVPKEKQTTKGSISEALKGLEKGQQDKNGLKIYKVNAWDYAGMCEVFENGIEEIRRTHVPALFHVEEVTQPQGHSTSGSHERYKTTDRLEWEREWDCLKKFKEWILDNDLAQPDELEMLEMKVRTQVKESKDLAWKQCLEPVKEMAATVLSILESDSKALQDGNQLQTVFHDLKRNREPLRRDVMKALGAGIDFAQHETAAKLQNLYADWSGRNSALFNSHLYVQGPGSALEVPVVPAMYDDQSTLLNGYEILNKYFESIFSTNPLVFAFGEDVGNIGDVNQGFAGLQKKFGETRIFDTGIREATIMGQGIGMALRGLRPIAEIQYIDYLLYGLQPLSDDVASLHYRTFGQQRCPLIVRTRGHRLEGIWHSGSPMALMLNSLQGMYICVPRNMVQAAGMYNTLLRAQEPAIMVECLNGYRLKEQLPINLDAFTVPLGIAEVIKSGADITLVSYGSTLKVVIDASHRLQQLGIDVEVVDVQTLLPFDRTGVILESLKKTNRILFVDEDVPGGATAYMYNHVLEKQGGYRWLDATPRTLSSQPHRPAYGSDGDYFSKPNCEDIVRLVKQMMAE